MAIYMPPIARKKRVPGHYNPDSFRVISTYAEETHPSFQERQEPPQPVSGPQIVDSSGLVLPDIYNRKTQVLPKSVPDYRANRPHPGGCGFLRYNVRHLNEPICSVYTQETHDEQNLWWPSRTSKEPLNVPPKTNDTIYRGDFGVDEDRKSAGSTRHSANPNKDPAHGTVPVNFLRARDGDQRLFKENISYEHQYDSRVDINYPRRGKRHGSFVWKQMSPDETRNFIDRQMSDIGVDLPRPNPLLGEDGNVGKSNGGILTPPKLKSPTELTKENSQEVSSKSVSFVDEKNGGADVKASPSETNIAGNALENSNDQKTIINNGEKSENDKQNGDENNKPNSKNCNRNGTIKIQNGLEPELMESLGMKDSSTAVQ